MTMQSAGPGKLTKKTTTNDGDVYTLRVVNPSPPPIYEFTQIKAEPTDGRMDNELEELFDKEDETVEVTYDDTGSSPYSVASVSNSKP